MRRKISAGGSGGSPEFPAVAAPVRFLAMRAGGRSETRKRLPLSVPYVLPFLIAARNRAAPRVPRGNVGAGRRSAGGVGRRGTGTGDEDDAATAHLADPAAASTGAGMRRGRRAAGVTGSCCLLISTCVSRPPSLLTAR